MERFPKFEENDVDKSEINQDLALVDDCIFVKPNKQPENEQKTLDDFDIKNPRKKPSIKEMKDKIVRRKYTKKTPTVNVLDPEKDFERFVNYMEKYEKIKEEKRIQKLKDEEEKMRQEALIEEAYFKKFQEQSNKKKSTHLKIQKAFEEQPKKQQSKSNPVIEVKNPYDSYFQW